MTAQKVLDFSLTSAKSMERGRNPGSTRPWTLKTLGNPVSKPSTLGDRECARSCEPGSQCRPN
jgi:hypothetical protein